MDDRTVFNCRLTRSRPTKLTISNSIFNSIINSSKASTALPTASNSILNSDSTTATQRLKQLTKPLLITYTQLMEKESSCSVDFALQCGKVWNKNFIGREFCNTFVLIRDSGLCLFAKKSHQRINPRFSSSQLYKTVWLIAYYFLSRNKIRFKHSFVSAQVFELSSSTGPLGFPNKVCDSISPYVSKFRSECLENINKLFIFFFIPNFFFIQSSEILL